MTEDQWRNTVSFPRDFITDCEPFMTGRQLRLLACAFCRLVWDNIYSVASRDAVEQAEYLADNPDLSKNNPALDKLREHTNTGCLQRLPRSAANVAIGWATAMRNDWAIPLEQKAADLAFLDFQKRQCEVVREIVGNPFQPMLVRRPEWFTGEVMQLAQSVYKKRQENGALDTLGLLALADALQEAGCDYPALDQHLRQRSLAGHFRGCWAVDYIRGQS